MFQNDTPLKDSSPFINKVKYYHLAKVIDATVI